MSRDIYGAEQLIDPFVEHLNPNNAGLFKSSFF